MACYPTDIREEELKIRVANDWFAKYDTAKIVGNVDFCVCVGELNLIWGEAKRGTSHDIYESFVQLLLTIGKEKTFDDYMPATFLCAFDAEKIAFIEYHKVMDIFVMNDFDWKVTPSDHSSTEFQVLQSRVQKVLEEENLLYYYDKNAEELRNFISQLQDVEPLKFQIDKNNFKHIYNKWVEQVKPTIEDKWDSLRRGNYLDADFFLADLLSNDGENETLWKKLRVLLQSDKYKYNAGNDGISDLFGDVYFTDDQKAHTAFWNKYKRPPRDEYWEYIVSRRDLLVPPDVRERKGSFYTPQIWVEKSQEYLAKELGEDWQDNYYIWDCCAGTGNMLSGLVNPDRVFASTLDGGDVRIMKQTMAGKGLLDAHIFEFDFLNWDFNHPNVPEKLKNIIKNEPEKLVMYINPPYAEAGTTRQRTGTGENKSGVAVEHLYNKKYKDIIKSATNELFALFLFRIYSEIPGCKIGQFSKLKHLQGPNFSDFRKHFKARLLSLFLVPADSFDNVKGQFPIGFHIWDAKVEDPFKKIKATVFDKKGFKLPSKIVKTNKGLNGLIGKWLIEYSVPKDYSEILGELNSGRNDFQHQNVVNISNHISVKRSHAAVFRFTEGNFIVGCVFLAVRQCIPATWINDRDQFLYPKKSWEKDIEFHNDCLAYTLFHGQNRISCKQGINHFIPFREIEVGAKDSYKSRFMIDYLAGKVQAQESKQIFAQKTQKLEPVVFSPEAQAVMDCGKELFKYYHGQPNDSADASFYDIRLRFQGVDAKGRMNPSSNNEKYNELLQNLRDAQKILAKKIEAKVYEHGFLEE